MFGSFGFFQSILCPDGNDCTRPNCTAFHQPIEFQQSRLSEEALNTPYQQPVSGTPTHQSSPPTVATPQLSDPAVYKQENMEDQVAKQPVDPDTPEGPKPQANDQAQINYQTQPQPTHVPSSASDPVHFASDMHVRNEFPTIEKAIVKKERIRPNAPHWNPRHNASAPIEKAKKRPVEATKAVSKPIKAQKQDKEKMKRERPASLSSDFSVLEKPTLPIDLGDDEILNPVKLDATISKERPDPHARPPSRAIKKPVVSILDKPSLLVDLADDEILNPVNLDAPIPKEKPAPLARPPSQATKKPVVVVPRMVRVPAPLQEGPSTKSSEPTNVSKSESATSLTKVEQQADYANYIVDHLLKMEAKIIAQKSQAPKTRGVWLVNKTTHVVRNGNETAPPEKLQLANEYMNKVAELDKKIQEIEAENGKTEMLDSKPEPSTSAVQKASELTDVDSLFTDEDAVSEPAMKRLKLEESYIDLSAVTAVPKCESRRAHIPEMVSKQPLCDDSKPSKAIAPLDIRNPKVPLAIRLYYLHMLYEEYHKTNISKNEAVKLAQHEEKAILDRSNAKDGYQTAVDSTLKRLRDEDSQQPVPITN